MKFLQSFAFREGLDVLELQRKLDVARNKAMAQIEKLRKFSDDLKDNYAIQSMHFNFMLVVDMLVSKQYPKDEYKRNVKFLNKTRMLYLMDKLDDINNVDKSRMLNKSMDSQNLGDEEDFDRSFYGSNSGIKQQTSKAYSAFSGSKKEAEDETPLKTIDDMVCSEEDLINFRFLDEAFDDKRRACLEKYQIIEDFIALDIIQKTDEVIQKLGGGRE